MKRLFILIAAAGMLLNAQAQQRVVGGDISLLPSYEQYNTPYYDQQGTRITDLVTYAAETLHWNACRVRLFVNPVITNADGTKQGEVQDITYITPLCQRIKQAGMQILLDFHYSDTWADPVKQTIPTAWQSLTEQELQDTVYGYTKMCLETLVAAGVAPDYVQIGNEVSYGMLWRGTSNNTTDKAYATGAYSNSQTQWERFSTLLGRGAQAVREVCPEAKIVIHIERTATASTCVNFYNYLNLNNVDYDIIGLSYYPFWHGWLDNQLQSTLLALHNAHPTKPIQIVETAYYNNYWPSTGISYDTRGTWPASAAGQAAFLTALINKLANYDFVTGLYYWFPEENSNGGASWNANQIVITNWLNRGLFHPSTHKALAGLYTLDAFLPQESTALTNTDTTPKDERIFTLTGTCLGTDLQALPQGVYIQGGKLIIR